MNTQDKKEIIAALLNAGRSDLANAIARSEITAGTPVTHEIKVLMTFGKLMRDMEAVERHVEKLIKTVNTTDGITTTNAEYAFNLSADIVTDLGNWERRFNDVQAAARSIQGTAEKLAG